MASEPPRSPDNASGKRGDLAEAVLVCLGLVVAGWAAVEVVTIAVRSRRTGPDYYQDYLAARGVRAGLSAYIPYTEDVLTRTPMGWVPFTLNDHPPTYIMALFPLSYLTYTQAFQALAVLNVTAGAVMAWLVGRELRLQPVGQAWLLAAVLLHPGLTICVAVGNTSVVLAGLVTAGWAAARRGRNVGAGAVLGTATVMKLYPGLLVVGLATARRWRAVTAAVAAGVCWLTLTLIVIGPEDVVTFATVRVVENAGYQVSNGYNLSLPGACHRLFGGPSPVSAWQERLVVAPGLAAGMSFVLQGVVISVSVVRLLRSGRTSASVDRAFALLIPAMILVSTLSWYHFLPVMLLPIALLTRDFVANRSYPRLTLMVLATTTIWTSDHYLANRVLAICETTMLPWWGNVIALAPAWGVLGVWLLALTSPTDVGPTGHTSSV